MSSPDRELLRLAERVGQRIGEAQTAHHHRGILHRWMDREGR